MSRYYDEKVIYGIQSRLNIVDVISETVNLSRRGSHYWGICPFHEEKTPSLCVTPEKNMFYCFGCHAGGDMFSFVMKRDGVSFREAVEALASKAGIEIDYTARNNQHDIKEKVVEVNKAAAEFYHRFLLNSAEAKKYLDKRGIKPETWKAFQLGYAPGNWDSLKDYLFKKGFSGEYVRLSGLIKRSKEKSGFYDMFRNRIMFPIYYYNGDVVGFGGRVLDGSLPKYINTPETRIFSKRHVLYGLFQARDTIRQNNEVIIVEGYMDCIKLHQAGIKNTVASLGTAFTREQAQLLRRYTENVVIIYDGDEAGQREALRAGETLAAEGFKTYVLVLPDGKDPDDYIEFYEKEEFLRYIKNNRISYIEFKINRYINSQKDLDLYGKIQILNLIKNDIAELGSELEKDYYIKILAQKLMLEENIIHREFTQKDGVKRNKTKTTRDNIKYGNYSLEEKILAAMFSDIKTFNRVKSILGLDFFSRLEYRDLAKMYDEMEGPEDARLKTLGYIASREGMGSFFTRIMFLCEKGLQINEIELQGFIRRAKLLEWESRWRKIYSKLNMLYAEGDFNNLLGFILNLDRFLNDTREGGIIK